LVWLCLLGIPRLQFHIIKSIPTRLAIGRPLRQASLKGYPDGHVARVVVHVNHPGLPANFFE
jgi:hypothetical protein